MPDNNPYQQYRQNAIKYAGRGQLTLMLYEGAVNFIREGARHIDEENIEGAHRAIVRAQEIFTHLGATLNFAYPLANSLALLYDYINRRLLEANVKKDKEILAEALGLAEELRDAWAQAVKLAGTAAVNL